MEWYLIDVIKHEIVWVDVAVADADLIAAQVVNDVEELQENVLALILSKLGGHRLFERLAVHLVVKATEAVLSWRLEHLRYALALDHVHHEVHGALHLVVKGVVHFHDIVVIYASQELVLFVRNFNELHVVGSDDLDREPSLFLLSQSFRTGVDGRGLGRLIGRYLLDTATRADPHTWSG